MTDATAIVTDLGTFLTDATGKYSASTTVPANMAPGSVTVTASALSATATATFTHNNSKK